MTLVNKADFRINININISISAAVNSLEVKSHSGEALIITDQNELLLEVIARSHTKTN